MKNISRRKFIKGVGSGITFAALSSYLPLSGCSAEEDYPNIVIIFTDDQGFADVGTYGAKGFTTPHLDKMASEGIRFTDFQVSTAVCSASRASLLTGCYSERVSIRGALNPSSNIGLNPEEENIAKLLKKKNYKTGIFGKWHLGHHEQFLPLQQGFDEYFGLPYSNDMWPVDFDGNPVVEGWKKSYPELKLYEGNTPVEIVANLEDQAQLTTRYTERAVKFIEKNKNDRFFCYLPHSMPHVPLAVSDKFKGKSEQGLYGDVIMEIDWSVGQVLKALKDNNLDENTLVIFTSDNGPWLNYGDHAGSADPLREGKGTMWEGGVRVPCIMRWPGKIKSNSVYEDMTSTIDFLPTVAAITESKPPKNKIDGVSLLPILMGKTNENTRDEFWYYYDYDLIAVRKDDWKLYFPCTQRSYDGMEPGTDGHPGKTWRKKIDYELYNLKNDVEEKLNIIADHPDIVDRLKKIGDKARLELGDRLTKTKGKENREPGRVGAKRSKFENHLAVGKKISLTNESHPKYGYGETAIIINGWKGTLDYNDGRWLGFQGHDFEGIIDLEKLTEISSINASFLRSQSSWIFLPEKVELSVSSDGKNYKKVAQFTETTKSNLTLEAKEYSKQITTECRYIKVYAKNINDCPDWHRGKGGKAWLFIDEIVIK